MEPRLESRGILYIVGNYLLYIPLLQWSRGSKAAESGLKSALSGEREALQWSRGSKAAESVRAFAVASGCTRLQWSRGSKAAES